MIHCWPFSTLCPCQSKIGDLCKSRSKIFGCCDLLQFLMALDGRFLTSVFLLPFLFLGRDISWEQVGGNLVPISSPSPALLFPLLVWILPLTRVTDSSPVFSTVILYLITLLIVVHHSFMLQLFSAPIISFFVHTCLHITAARTYDQCYKQMGTFLTYTLLYSSALPSLSPQSSIQPLHILLMSHDIKRGTELD